tara:strand:+ start:147 stop:950 length:804 start_codon:yes stop_codon:yes gene_type:complete
MGINLLKILEPIDSIAAIVDTTGNAQQKTAVATKKFEQSYFVNDEILIDYVSDDNTLPNDKISNFRNLGVDVDLNKIYNALDAVNADDPAQNDLVKKITNTDNFMYTTDTPKGVVRKVYHDEKPKTGFKFGTERYFDPKVNADSQQGWTAANSFGLGVGNVLGESSYFDTYNNEMENIYDRLIGEENPLGPNFLYKSWLKNEQTIGAEIQSRYGEDTFKKAHLEASKLAKIEQKAYMKARLTDDPYSTKSNSIIKALNYLDEHKAQI